MKKIFYSFAILSLLFTSCNPMEEIYTDIDSAETVISGEAVFTLTDADYETLELNYGNFSSTDDAKEALPGFLTDKFPVWGAESLAAVTFKLYNRVNTYSRNIYELSDDEHNAITGKTYGNFDKSYHVTNYLEATYPDAERGDFYSLRYRFYSGGESTLTDGFAFENDEWTKITGFTEEEYNAMGESYPNFSSHDEAEAKTPVALLDIYKFAPKNAGDIVSTMYELYKGGGVTKSYTANYISDGSTFSKYNNVINETIKFGHDGTSWVPDNTIKYTLTAADYELVGNGNYGNFDVRAGKDEELESVRLDKVNTILLNNFPSDEEGQKYIISYNIYNGANGVWSLAVIKEGSAYVKQ